jgi:quercetin dioxygenase-like cupin family protein
MQPNPEKRADRCSENGKSVSIEFMRFILGMLLFGASVLFAQTKATPLMTRDLKGIPGKEGMMLVVEYPPGVKSASHRHNASTFVYVLEGSVVMAVKGGKELTLGPGETFYESPDDIHSVSRNASDTKPAKILVFFVKEKGAPASVPAQ